MFNEDDELFGGTAEKKYFDIMFNANRNLVEFYMTENLEKIAVMETLLEETHGSEEELHKVIKNYAVNNAEELESKVKDLYIYDMGKILSQNE